MQWIAAAIILLAGLAGMFLVVRSGAGARRKGVGGAFVVGLAEALDPNVAMIALENEKRANMEGDEDNGDPPYPEIGLR